MKETGREGEEVVAARGWGSDLSRQGDNRSVKWRMMTSDSGCTMNRSLGVSFSTLAQTAICHYSVVEGLYYESKFPYYANSLSKSNMAIRTLLKAQVKSPALMFYMNILAVL